ncbi:MAG: hypothetical protein OXE87_02585 [Chloroflexi bacterium]|nr:hypothetical protein [Chloroflexota bacterium]
MVAYARRNAAIATSVGAMLVSVLLIIFFGAWAVSASSEAGVSELVTSATAGFSGNLSSPSIQSAAGVGSPDGENVPRLATDPSGGATASDTWWGKALLGACPLH